MCIKIENESDFELFTDDNISGLRRHRAAEIALRQLITRLTLNRLRVNEKVTRLPGNRTQPSYIFVWIGFSVKHSVKNGGPVFSIYAMRQNEAFSSRKCLLTV